MNFSGRKTSFKQRVICQAILLPSLLFATPAIWDGTADTTWYTNDKEATEYTITTAEQLAGLAFLVNGSGGGGSYYMSGKTIKLGADIVLNDTAANGGWQNWNENATELTQWTAIGNSIAHYYLSFEGTFDGNGHIVSGVYINNTSGGQGQGLFGSISSKGTIKNLGVVASYIKGNGYVGGLVGGNYNGTVINSYATGNMSGNSYVGGLVGCNYGAIINSYATGNVVGSSSVGGLVGGDSDGTTINSYYDSKQASGQSDTGKGIPKTTEYMQSEEFVHILNDYAVFSEITSTVLKWEYNAGGYPKLSSEHLPAFNVADFFESGDGSEGSPYIIKDKRQLTNFSTIVNLGKDNFANKYVALGADIKLNDTTDWQSWNETTEGLNLWTGINGFSGTFDGDGYVISGIYGTQGLFGSINSSSTIKNLGVVASYINSSSGNIGGLVGWNNGTIINSYATGNVDGNGSYYSTGGFVGNNNGGTIINSYATGNVVGSSYYVGGLVGYLFGGTINNSYATGNVKGTQMVGGLVGSNGGGTITNSYYNIETSGQTDAGKGEGKTTAQMQTKSTYSGWDFDDVWDIDGKFFNSGMPYFQWQNTMRQMQAEPIEPQLYTGSQIKPTPKVTAPNGTELIPGTDFDYYYDENIHVANGGTVYIVDKTEKYYGALTVNFIIKPSKTVNVYWYPECGTIYTYNGESQGPTPYAADYEVTANLETNAGIGITAIAKLATPEDDVVLQGASCAYTIAPKPLAVTWTADSVFTYNKMTQAPTPSVSEPNIKLLRHNAHAAAGIYKDENAASAEIEDQEQARNYNLTNRTKNYEILKKDLKPYFTAILPPEDFNPSVDTLWVPYEVFADSAALHTALSGLIDYAGFATDTVSKTSDDTTALKGKPTIALQYAPLILQRRVETTQKATAIIVTDAVTADNYTLTRPAIVIMATVVEDENAEKVFCRLGDKCVQFSVEVCSAISGQIVESCNIKVACVINSVCVENIDLETCSLVGDVVPSCDEVPILHPQLSSGSLRVWQTASGMVSVDLGYMPAAPVVLRVYDLKGKLVASERVSTRFANIKVNVPSGVYLFRVGGRNAVEVVK